MRDACFKKHADTSILPSPNETDAQREHTGREHNAAVVS